MLINSTCLIFPSCNPSSAQAGACTAAAASPIDKAPASNCFFIVVPLGRDVFRAMHCARVSFWRICCGVITVAGLTHALVEGLARCAAARYGALHHGGQARRQPIQIE